MDDTTARFGWPLLAPGQAQKEMAHNEALALIDMALQPVVEAVGVDVPPANPVVGQQWLVGDAPVAAWAERAGWLAGWTAGGWRFVSPRAPMTVIRRADGMRFRRVGDDWVGAAAVAPPSGGAVVDVKARDAVVLLIEALRDAGLLAA